MMQWDILVRVDNVKLHSAQGGEYLGRRMAWMLKDRGVQHQTTPSYTPEHNGVAERFNRMVQDMLQSYLMDANLADKYWAEALLMAVHVYNHLCKPNADGTNQAVETLPLVICISLAASLKLLSASEPAIQQVGSQGSILVQLERWLINTNKVVGTNKVKLTQDVYFLKEEPCGAVRMPATGEPPVSEQPHDSAGKNKSRYN